MLDLHDVVPPSAEPDLLHADVAGQAEDLVARVAALRLAWAEASARADADARVSEAGLAQLRDAGALIAPLPVALGGLGLGTQAEGAPCLLALLRQIGRGDLSLGRIFEGHVNALKLVRLYGTADQLRAAAADAAAGHLFAVWVTERDNPVTFAAATAGMELRGCKAFCSAAAQATRALITARPEDGAGEEPGQLLLIPLCAGERARQGGFDLHGMRGAGTADVDFTGLVVGADSMIGRPGDYLRQPEFSAGAWRAAAVALGGLDALVDEVRGQLRARRRADDPHQKARLGAILIAAETASLWAGKAARIAEAGTARPEDVAAYVNLARLAIEAACLDAMRDAQRALGLAAFIRPNPVERLLRDLATYLRQPAPDETLTEAASWFTTHPLPDLARAATGGHVNARG